jgi:hypothetical protein
MSSFEHSNSASLDLSIKLMTTLVKYIYYGVKDVTKYQYLIDRIKNIRYLDDVKNKRLKFILSELISNAESSIKTFKPLVKKTYQQKYVKDREIEPEPEIE